MPDRNDRWTDVGAAITRRIENELGLTLAEFSRRSGISFKTLQRYMAGAPVVRRDKVRDLTAALGWTLDSIDLILAGGEPRLLEPSGPDRAQAMLGEQLRQMWRDRPAGLNERPGWVSQADVIRLVDELRQELKAEMRELGEEVQRLGRRIDDLNDLAEARLTEELHREETAAAKPVGRAAKRSGQTAPRGGR